jgi:hypothetical protein
VLSHLQKKTGRKINPKWRQENIDFAHLEKGTVPPLRNGFKLKPFRFMLVPYWCVTV